MPSRRPRPGQHVGEQLGESRYEAAHIGQQHPVRIGLQPVPHDLKTDGRARSCREWVRTCRPHHAHTVGRQGEGERPRPLRGLCRQGKTLAAQGERPRVQRQAQGTAFVIDGPCHLHGGRILKAGIAHPGANPDKSRVEDGRFVLHGAIPFVWQDIRP